MPYGMLSDAAKNPYLSIGHQNCQVAGLKNQSISNLLRQGMLMKNF
jgi:hypothetical protein